MKQYFITGTDTDSGKTYVTCALLRHYKNSAAVKPVASGCEAGISDDAQSIARDSIEIIEHQKPWRFNPPISPHIAAQQVEEVITVADIFSYVQHIQTQAEYLFIEGAGGVMVPLNTKETWLDFLTLSKVPVVLVVGMTLGCINHALLSASVLKTSQIECAGWIANFLDPEMLCLEENIVTLKSFLDIPFLGRVAYQGDFESTDLLAI